MDQTASDAELIAAFADQGNEQAFTILFNRHKTALYRYILHHAYSRDDAPDITQQAWIKALDALAKHQYSVRDGVSFKAWLYAVANNCRVDYYRRRRIGVVGSGDVSMDAQSEDHAQIEPVSDADPAKDAERGQLREAYFKALEELPPEQRQAYLLKEDGDLSVEEIASVMKVGFETAKSYLRYAREKLREKLRDWHDFQQ